MGVPVDFEGTNFTYAAGDIPNCQDLKVYTNGLHNVSAWQLTEAEMKQVRETGKIYLSLMTGLQFPPVFVGSEDSVREVIANDHAEAWSKVD